MNYKNILLPKVDVFFSSTLKKFPLDAYQQNVSETQPFKAQDLHLQFEWSDTQTGYSINRYNNSTEFFYFLGMQTVHYSIYLPAAAETITLSSVSKEVTQLEDKITKSIPSMLVNSSFIERINEIEKRILPIDDTHLRNITLNLKVFLISSLSDEHRCL